MARKKPKLKLDHVLTKGDFVPPDGYKPGKGHDGHQKSFTSTRTALHLGRKIKVKTTYRIEIDGEPLTMHTEVLDDGTVHCHGLPNYSFASAVDLAKAVVNASRYVIPPRNELGGGRHGDHQGSHGGGHH